MKNAPPAFVLDSTIMHLSTFKDDRQLKETKDDYLGALGDALGFENVFHETMLSAFFRRYLRLTFCEENYFFLKEVRDVKSNRAFRRRSWMDETRLFQFEGEGVEKLSPEEELKQKVISVCQHYIVEGRKYEVNIPHKVKLEILAELDADNYHVNMFDKAENEIERILQFDSFERFKKHFIWDHLKRAFFVKFSQRNFVVGETVKLEQNIERIERQNSLGEKAAGPAMLNWIPTAPPPEEA